MRTLLYITAALILIAAIVPVHAVDYTCANGYDHTTFHHTTDYWAPTIPYTMNRTGSYTDTGTYCTLNGGSGLGGSYSDYRLGYYGMAPAVFGSSPTENTNWTSNQVGNYSAHTVSQASTKYSIIAVRCNGVAGSDWIPYSCYDVGGVGPIPNFTGTPLTGTIPLNVTFTISNYSSINPAGYNYITFGDGQRWNITDSTVTHTYDEAGIYSVSMTYVNYAGATNTITRTDYVNAQNSTGEIQTNVVARNLFTGVAIDGAAISIKDVENSTWSNTTSAPLGRWSIYTLAGHTLDMYGSASGYDPDDLIGVGAVQDGWYSLLLRPTNITTFNATAGNLTLFVTVEDIQLPHPTITGAEVTASWGSQYASGTTDAAGSTSFTVPNNTAIYLSAFKTGYTSGSKAYITGSANGGSATETTVMYIGTDYVTPTATVTWTGTGTVPPTVDPYPCIGDGSAQDTANCQRKQGGMAADLIGMGPTLVQFFIMLTFLGGIMLITKRR